VSLDDYPQKRNKKAALKETFILHKHLIFAAFGGIK